MLALIKDFFRVVSGTTTWEQLAQERQRKEELFFSNYTLSLHGQELGYMSDMYIPDQFWKHYKFKIKTSDAELKRRMLEEDRFWYSEPLVLTREFDGAQFHINTDGECVALFAMENSALLRKTGEVALRGL